MQASPYLYYHHSWILLTQLQTISFIHHTQDEGLCSVGVQTMDSVLDYSQQSATIWENSLSSLLIMEPQSYR